MPVKEFAESLRKFEKIRDASDKIRGFLYQDLLAVEIILDSREDDKIFVEWVEDIYVEGINDITMYQVKYYTTKRLNINHIYDNMLFQYLKYALVTMNYKPKKLNTVCMYYASNITKLSKKPLSFLSYVREVSKIELESINAIANKIPKFKDIEDYVITELGKSEVANGFNFDEIRKNEISNERSKLKVKIGTFIKKNNFNTVLLGSEIEEILLSISLQYIQKTYYSKSEVISERVLTKKNLIELFNELLLESEESKSLRIVYRTLSYIDSVFNVIYSEIKSDEAISFYKEIYFSTKTYFEIHLKDKNFQFKFINTISNDKSSVLNKKDYLEDKHDRYEVFLEHKCNIELFFSTLWKIMFNINCKHIDKYIKENEDFIIFGFPEECVDSVLVSSSIKNSTHAASGILSRVNETSIKPDKWYVNDIKGTYTYDINITKIKDAIYKGEYEINNKDNACFIIECLNCISCDEGDMQNKDDKIFEMFKINCCEENKNDN